MIQADDASTPLLSMAIIGVAASIGSGRGPRPVGVHPPWGGIEVAYAMGPPYLGPPFGSEGYECPPGVLYMRSSSVPAKAAFVAALLASEPPAWARLSVARCRIV